MSSTTFLEIPTTDGTADAWLVKPESDGVVPGVLMFMDAFGPRPRLIGMAERVAASGRAVLLPNLLYRSGRAPLVEPSDLQDASRREGAFARLGPMMKTLRPDRIAADTGAYLDVLSAQPDVAPGPVAVVGYCMGGRTGLRAIQAYPDRICALGSFHAGGLVTDALDSPHLNVGQITGEVYFGHADQDRSMTPDQIADLEKALDEAGVRYTSEVYEGSPHGYTMSDTAMYHEPGEHRHWENLFGLLDRALPVRQH
jgi:carboxymethylenebutenolidase